jgi:hypothetical protein
LVAGGRWSLVAEITKVVHYTRPVKYRSWSLVVLVAGRVAEEEPTTSLLLLLCLLLLLLPWLLLWLPPALLALLAPAPPGTRTRAGR